MTQKFQATQKFRANSKSAVGGVAIVITAARVRTEEQKNQSLARGCYQKRYHLPRI